MLNQVQVTWRNIEHSGHIGLADAFILAEASYFVADNCLPFNFSHPTSTVKFGLFIPGHSASQFFSSALLSCFDLNSFFERLID